MPCSLCFVTRNIWFMPCNLLCTDIPLLPQGTLAKPASPQAWCSKVNWVFKDEERKRKNKRKNKRKKESSFFLGPQVRQLGSCQLRQMPVPSAPLGALCNHRGHGLQSLGRQASADIVTRNHYVLEECFSAKEG